MPCPSPAAGIADKPVPDRGLACEARCYGRRAPHLRGRGKKPCVRGPGLARTAPEPLRARQESLACKVPSLACEEKSLAREARRSDREAKKACPRGSEACPQGFELCDKAKSLAAGAPRLAPEAVGSGEADRCSGGGGQGLDLALAGEAGGHALPERVQACAFAGHLEQGVAFQRRAHHVAAERRLAIVGLLQQAAQRGRCTDGACRGGRDRFGRRRDRSSAGGDGCSGPAP